MPLHWLLQSTLEKYIPSSTSLKAHYNLPPNIWKVSVLDSSFRVSNWLLSWPNRLLKKNRGLRKNNKFFHYKRMFQYQHLMISLMVLVYAITLSRGAYILVLIFCVEFRELYHLTHDLFQAEKKINVVTSWENAQNDIYFTQNGWSCHFEWK